MTSVPVVQLADAQAAEQIALMSRDHIEQGLEWAWTEKRVLRAIRDPEVNVAVVQERQTVQAFGIMCYGDRDAHLVLLAVRPTQRRRGLATAIVTWLEAVALAAGSRRILVECRRSNDAARCLYQNLGYHERRIERGMYAQHEDGIRLEKWLQVQAGEARGGCP